MADDMMDPRPPFANGWFLVVPSKDLAAGGMRTQKFLGEDVVAWRSEAGDAVVASAYCPHMGAHLGHGGKVVGDTIRCPYHGLHWNGEGRCLGESDRDATSWDVKLPIYPTVERSGLVLAWHHHARDAPSWELPELDPDGWTAPRVTTIPIATHLESIVENGADTAHFAAVHNFELGEGSFEDRGLSFHSEFSFKTVNYFGGGPECLTTFFETDNFGLGYAVSVNHCEEIDLLYRVFILGTPTIAGEVDLSIATSYRHSTDCERIVGRPSAEIEQIVHKGAVGGAYQDKPIWENLRYTPRPRLRKTDGPIAQFRAFAARFYADH